MGAGLDAENFEEEGVFAFHCAVLSPKEMDESRC